MLLLIGASASGKTEISKIIIKKYGFNKMITYTTRDKRVGEVDGVDYYFLSKDKFLKKQKEDYFLETTFYNNNYYGTAFKDADKKKVLIVDVNGANKIFEYMQDEVVIFLLEATEQIREERMRLRGDTKEQINARLDNDRTYFIEENINHIDYVIDTTPYSLEELADKIYHLYINHIND